VKRLDEAIEPAQTAQMARPLPPIGALGPAPGSIVGSH
jgi:hypothetical protein